MIKYLTAALAVLALAFGGCDSVWRRDIDGCKVEIRDLDGGVLEITVHVPRGNEGKFPEDSPGDFVVEHALAEYLGVSEGGNFECPGLNAVDERHNGNGRIFVFHLPKASLRVTKK